MDIATLLDPSSSPMRVSRDDFAEVYGVLTESHLPRRSHLLSKPHALDILRALIVSLIHLYKLNDLVVRNHSKRYFMPIELALLFLVFRFYFFYLTDSAV